MSAPSPRRVAFDVLRQVTGDDAYANLALAKRLATAGLDPRDAALATELVSGVSGETEEKIRQLFETAKKHSPCVLVGGPGFCY